MGRLTTGSADGASAPPLNRSVLRGNATDRGIDHADLHHPAHERHALELHRHGPGGYKAIDITGQDTRLFSLTCPLYVGVILVAIPKYTKGGLKWIPFLDLARSSPSSSS